MSEKIAILVDSGLDIPKDKVAEYGIFVAPLNIHYKAATFQDGVNITSQEVYEKVEEEIPSTSTPTGQQIVALLEKIAADGYTHVIAVTISSGLSGALNAIRVQAEAFPQLTFAFIDTKNISIAGGMTAIRAARCVAAGKSFTEIVPYLENGLKEMRVFFYVDTLKYLQKGGRIGRVAGMVGQLLNIKPIISCDEEGIYYPIAKERGNSKAIKKMLALAEEFADASQKVSFVVLNANETVHSKALFRALKEKYPQAVEIYETDISAALGVHTGPGAIGIAVEQVHDL